MASNVEGDAAINAPNWDTTKKIQKSALAYLLSDSNLPGDVVIVRRQDTARETVTPRARRPARA